MPKTLKKSATADEIAEMASQGEDVSSYFANRFTVVRPVKQVTDDLTPASAVPCLINAMDERNGV
jgi:hypothetical protein